ncbi:gamma-glutamyltransferase [Roseospirillum parvum]|uniref:Gamma-glutamyltranspeptidase / glutathione hydrolase n=1 Tax=Roseospirillum parvum TaxID=83401 RepID=A0A1G8ERM4_9PROT|nr:gamma-glutamyltransferase [Roseospirillum parvum]SDH72379.1 gamma-glutamyltranspeptidase / glutathione hydrolase [Roseospirillum parvum]
MSGRGAVAAGHPVTADVAAEVLKAGGNAVDAALAGVAAACVAEPVLASLGGGGFLLVHPPDRAPLVCDFFTHTPRRRRPLEEVDFHPIVADFGTVTQDFHIGQGAVAVPGLPRGLVETHRRFGHMPLTEVVAPAVTLAGQGVPLSALQAYILSVVGPIFTATEGARALYCDPDGTLKGAGANGTLKGAGATIRLPNLGPLLEELAREGDRFFYEGEPGQRLLAAQAEGGFLGPDDLSGYRMELRRPLSVEVGGQRLFTNPPPSTGGVLIAFALGLLEGSGLAGTTFGAPGHLCRLVAAMAATNRARQESRLAEDPEGAAATLASASFVERHLAACLAALEGHPPAFRGTTHISVVDGAGGAAALTVSNGEGNGWILPGTDIMMNNMLGEEDLSPGGFHSWPTDTRLSSMMAPSLLEAPDGTRLALGSGGSNRIRTAILQVLANRLWLGHDLERAVDAPRLHFEAGTLNLEPGFSEPARRAVAALPDGMVDKVVEWDGPNMFFGGVHAVAHRATARGVQLAAVGDPRRGGAARLP